ncbi:hypothetical protein [Deinococcus arenicola]|uniref:DUF1963 domain-containing protein n=1 Tax=Deinococcus arenicola TaxID=2994950 RepID=A0ABU4DNR0_9DEIO|nr:hypothetical protein [Deinococcus sp. ZS9-10]MDV6373739.1 hypothetical protein [Deinococcus sp. ZS9-10]
MGRMRRFAQYAFAPWPDKELTERVNHFERPGITRVEQNFNGESALLVEIRDMAHSPDSQVMGDDGKWHANPSGIPGKVCLSWDGFHARVFALESYDEFYCGPYAHAYAWKEGTERNFLHEIVSEPDAWIKEILEDNPHTGVFPTGGQPVAALDSVLKRNPGMGVPTGRFFPPDVRLGDDGKHPVFFASDPPSAEDEAEMDRVQAEMLAQMIGKPRYRHLFIASDSHMLEILCTDLPSWKWVEE